MGKEYECLQNWVQHVEQMVRSEVNSLRKTVESKSQGILELNSVKECLKELQEKYMFVPADKAANNIIMVCKRYCLEVICKELGIDTYIPETMDPKEISGNHMSYMKSHGFKEDNLSDNFSSFYWTPKLHKTSYKHLTAQGNLCTPYPYLICLSSVIYSRTGINEIWILKNSSELLQKMNSFHYPKTTSNV